MNLFNKFKKQTRAIAMTEYLIILGIVAIAAIAITVAFGKQIKGAFSAAGDALNGKKSEVGEMDKTGNKKQNMGNFGEGADTKN